MLREKPKWLTIARVRVPMQSTGTETPIVGKKVL
jgi:hypothetical protein